MRARRRPIAVALCALAALVCAAAAMAGCGGSSDPVAQAAVTTAQQRGAQFEMALSFTVPGSGEQITMPGSGVLDLHAKRAQIRFDLSKLTALTNGRLPTGSSAIVDEVLLYPDAYLHAPFLTSALPSHKPWIKYNLQQAAQRSTGVDPTQLTTQNSPADQLQQLRASSGSATKVGTETVRGVTTTHYRGSIDLKKLASRVPPAQRQAAQQGINRIVQLTGKSTYPVDVWIDAHRLVRREHVALSYKLGSSQSLSFGVTLDLFNYGPAPAITPPPADQVYDATNLVPSQG